MTMNSGTARRLVLICVLQCCVVTVVYTETNDVDHILKRLEFLETKDKHVTETEREVTALRSIVDEQSRMINVTAAKLGRLESLVETLVVGQSTAGTHHVTGRRPALQITRGEYGHKTDEMPGDSHHPVAFMAYMKRFHSSDQYPSGAILPFEMTTINTGNAYNNTSGLFKCPSSGLYKLDWALAYYNPNILVPVTDRDYTLDVDFVIVYLNKSDTAGVTNPNDEGVFMPYLSKFAGFKLSQ